MRVVTVHRVFDEACPFHGDLRDDTWAGWVRYNVADLGLSAGDLLVLPAGYFRAATLEDAAHLAAALRVPCAVATVVDLGPPDAVTDAAGLCAARGANLCGPTLQSRGADGEDPERAEGPRIAALGDVGVAVLACEEARAERTVAAVERDLARFPTRILVNPTHHGHPPMRSDALGKLARRWRAAAFDCVDISVRGSAPDTPSGGLAVPRKPPALRAFFKACNSSNYVTGTPKAACFDALGNELAPAAERDWKTSSSGGVRAAARVYDLRPPGARAEAPPPEASGLPRAAVGVAVGALAAAVGVLARRWWSR